jgi:hypothetical protein
LTTLQKRTKWTVPSDSLKVGDMVLIRDPNLPPLKWKKARVIATHPDATGRVRVVTLKTADSEMQRPIQKLCLLPIPNESSQEIHGGRDVE